MRLRKRVIRQGDQTTFPSIGDVIGVVYIGWLYDINKEQNRGRKFDSSEVRGIFRTEIGIGSVIKGWDILVTQMSLGEKSVLEIPAEFGYGTREFPGFIPANSDLIFEVTLESINARA